jgi:hypothetical protein
MTQDLLTMPVLREMSSWGPDDPHIPKPHALAKDITDHLKLDATTKSEVDFFADRLMDKIESALMYYQLIMADNFEKRNISQKRTIYEGLYANLWSFYKGRVQNYLNKMGWDIAFFFCDEKNFAKKIEKFLDDNPGHEKVIEFAHEQRDAWQNNFGRSRNIAEHNGDYRGGASSYETPGDAKRLFAQVCWTAETLIAYLGSHKMDEDWNVVEVKPKATIFDREARYVVEHAVMTAQRERKPPRHAESQDRP